MTKVKVKANFKGLSAALLALALQTPLAAAAAPTAKPEAKPALTPAQEEARRQVHEKLRTEVLDQMRAMRMWKLTEELKIDEATAGKVFPTLAQFDDRAREIGRERREIGKQVRDQTEAQSTTGKVDNAKLRVLIDQLLANQRKRNALDEERFKALQPALSPLQQAKLLLLLPKLEDDFRRRIREAMEAQRQLEEGGTAGQARAQTGAQVGAVDRPAKPAAKHELPPGRSPKLE
jgi:hypothetical protein